jgi:hypothetical protein
VKAWLRRHGWDVLAVLSLAAIAGGMAWWLHPGIGLVVGGGGMLALAMAGAVHDGKG